MAAKDSSGTGAHFGAPSRAAVSCFLVMLFTVAVSLPGLISRVIFYDEALTLLQTAGNTSPDGQTAPGASSWPASPQPVGELKSRL